MIYCQGNISTSTGIAAATESLNPAEVERTEDKKIGKSQHPGMNRELWTPAMACDLPMQSITQVTEREPKLTSTLVTVCATLQKNAQIKFSPGLLLRGALVPRRMGQEPSSCWWKAELTHKATGWFSTAAGEGEGGGGEPTALITHHSPERPAAGPVVPDHQPLQKQKHWVLSCPGDPGSQLEGSNSPQHHLPEGHLALDKEPGGNHLRTGAANQPAGRGAATGCPIA